MDDQHHKAPLLKSHVPSMVSIVTYLVIAIALFTLAWQWLNTRHRFNDIENPSVSGWKNSRP